MATTNDSKHERLIADEQGIYQHVAADHRKVESLFDELASADDDVERMRELHVQLKREILLHTNVEDRVVYTPIEAHEQFAGTIEHSRDAHQDANALLLELDDLELGSPSFMDKAEELRQAIQTHVDEEEQEVLPAAFDVLDEAASREMARRYEDEKETELPTLMETEPGISELDEENLEDLSREELAELARQRSIEGRSHMTKEQLTQALRHHQG
jgi:hypothetical protein